MASTHRQALYSCLKCGDFMIGHPTNIIMFIEEHTMCENTDTEKNVDINECIDILRRHIPFVQARLPQNSQQSIQTGNSIFCC